MLWKLRISSHTSKIPFSLGLRWLRFSFFWECLFGRDQRSQFNNTFSKFAFAMEVLVICLPYVKRCLQFHQWNILFFRAQITQILLLLGMWVWERSSSQFNSDTFSKHFFAVEVLGMCLPYVKTYFQRYQWNAYFFRAQITQILLFRGKSVWERFTV